MLLVRRATLGTSAARTATLLSWHCASSPYMASQGRVGLSFSPTAPFRLGSSDLLSVGHKVQSRMTSTLAKMPAR